MIFWNSRCGICSSALVAAVVVGSGSVPASARNWAAPTSAATRTHAHADNSVSLCRSSVIPPDRRRLVTVPQSRTTGCQGVRRQICCRVSKGRCRRCGSLKPRELSEPEPPTARTPFSPHETTAGLTEREGSWASDIASREGKAMPLSKCLTALGAVVCAVVPGGRGRGRRKR